MKCARTQTLNSLSSVRDEMRGRLSEIDPVMEEWRDDGVLYCKLCGTPRSMTLDRVRHSFSYVGVPEGEVIKIRIPCECQIELQRRQEEEEAKLARIAESRRIIDNAFLGLRFSNSSFNDFETEGLDPSIEFAKKTLMRYCEKCDGVVVQKNLGVYIYGPTGTGKTEIMACMANELMKKHLKSCLFTSFMDICKQIKETFNNRKKTEIEIFNVIGSVDFLFIDDIGYEVLQNNKEDNWLQEKVYDIINTRYNANKPTIFSSNYSLQELCEKRGMQMATMERIAEMGSTVLRMNGESYRRKIARSLF